MCLCRIGLDTFERFKAIVSFKNLCAINDNINNHHLHHHLHQREQKLGGLRASICVSCVARSCQLTSVLLLLSLFCGVRGDRGGACDAVNPEPLTLNLKPQTLNPKLTLRLNPKL